MKDIFLEKLSHIYSPSHLKKVITGLETSKRPVTFRVNYILSNESEVEEALEKSNIKYKKIDVFSGIYQLDLDLNESDLWSLDIYTS